MPPLTVRRQDHAEALSPAESVLHLPHHLLRLLSLKYTALEQPIVVIICIHVGILHHKTSVALDDMGINQSIVDVQREGLVDGLNGDPRQQGGTLAPIPHGIALRLRIAHRYAQQQHPPALGGIPQDNLGLSRVQGAKEALRLPDGHRLPVEDIGLALGVVEGQIGKVPGHAVGAQGHDGHLVHTAHRTGRNGQGDPLHLGQLHLHQGIEMPLELGVDLLHVEIGHLGQDLIAFLSHDPAEPQEHAHTQSRQDQKTDPQKADGLFLPHRVPLPPPALLYRLFAIILYRRWKW